MNYKILGNTDLIVSELGLGCHQFVHQIDGISVVLPRAVNREELDENVGSLTAVPHKDDELKKIYLLA